MNFLYLFLSFFLIFFFFYQANVLSSHTVDGHQMYSRGSVEGNSETGTSAMLQ